MTDNHQIEAIIFDLGNVLIDFDHTPAAKKISRFTKKTPAEIFNLFFDSKLTRLFEEGRISPQEFFRRVKEMLRLKIDYDTFLPIWNDIFFLTEENHAVYNLAKRLKEHYQIALLSNINILHFDYLKKNFGVFDAFHNIFTSYELGVCKPNPSIYKHVLKTLKIFCAACVFYIDDRVELVEQAKGLGIKGFVFRDFVHLEHDLQSVGINSINHIK